VGAKAAAGGLPEPGGVIQDAGGRWRARGVLLFRPLVLANNGGDRPVAVIGGCPGAVIVVLQGRRCRCGNVAVAGGALFCKVFKTGRGAVLLIA